MVLLIAAEDWDVVPARVLVALQRVATRVQRHALVIRRKYLPKFGFKNINRIEYQPVNLSSIQKLAEKQNLTKVGIEELVAARLVDAKGLVKILGYGTLTAKVDVVAHAFSKSAEAAIQAAGGTATKL